MRDNIRKPRARHPAVVLLAVAALAAGSGSGARAATTTGHGPCTASHGTLGETDEPTPEISTEQMEVALARDIDKPLVIDARPYEEFAVSHIPGAVNVAGKAGLPLTRFTPDLGAIGKLVHGNIDTPIVLYCDGAFSGTSKRVAADLRNAGYTHVVRYQLGIPVWRALGHSTQSEKDAMWSTLGEDRTAVVIDARDASAFQAGSLPRARNVRFEEVVKAKDDGRLPMLDHNTRIFVVGKDGAQAFAAAQEIARNAFQNVSFCADSIAALLRAPHATGGRP
jgi:rhodanese-related sulfurtransferase